ncbi:MAG: OprO/OprP family phosphate-selective porin [Deltaproteobacteria bacterium]|nr:OprO/OprP family phosphate-selective porin [Deltaproteobacteria bacterium]
MKRVVLGLALVSVLPTLALAQPAEAPAPDAPAPDAPPPDGPFAVTEPAPPAPPTPVTPPPAPAPVEPAPAAPIAAPVLAVGKFAVSVGGYFQPQYRTRQNNALAPFDEDGFRLRRARLLVKGRADAHGVKVGVDVEAELTPAFQLLDAYVSLTDAVGADGEWSLAAGQVKAPFSRQTLLSDSKLGFVDKPELASLAPDRQIGVRGTFRVPHAPWVQLAAGVFNGEGKNQPQNIDEHLMSVARLELKPIGWDAPLEESAFGKTFVAIGASVARNVVESGDGNETDVYLGGDIAGAWNGISGAAEYLWIRHDFATGSAQPDYHANGLAVQAAYLLPLPGRWARRLELGGRVEEIDRNDAVPIVQPGDPNQSLRYFTAALNYYHWQHALKLQLLASHIVEVEDTDRNSNPAGYDNDQVLLQATFRME